MDAQARGIRGVTVDDVFMGNGVSELILMTHGGAARARRRGAESPRPTTRCGRRPSLIAGGAPVHYPCRPEAGFVPDPGRGRAARHAAHARARAHQPQQPHRRRVPARGRRSAGAPRRATAARALLRRDLRPHPLRRREHVPAAPLCEGTLCATFGGLSKVYRACGLRTGWVVLQRQKAARGGLPRRARAARLAAPLRERAGAMGGADGARRACRASSSSRRPTRAPRAPAPRRARRRRAARAFLHVVPPARRALRVPSASTAARSPQLRRRGASPWSCSSSEHVLVVPGSSFNVPYTDHLRLTLLPDEETMGEVFFRLNRALSAWAER